MPLYERSQTAGDYQDVTCDGPLVIEGNNIRHEELLLLLLVVVVPTTAGVVVR
jgi:hypothetical protein